MNVSLGRPTPCVSKSLFKSKSIASIIYTNRRSICGHRQLGRHQLVVASAQQQQEQQQQTTDVQSSRDDIPAGCSRYSINLSKPLGIVLEENNQGVITVAEIVPGSNADKADTPISVGDVLIATSGLSRTRESTYGETKVYSGEEIVRLSVRGESFDTVLAAIGSHPANMKVTLEFQRCE